jgi:hypothetical protein
LPCRPATARAARPGGSAPSGPADRARPEWQPGEWADLSRAAPVFLPRVVKGLCNRPRRRVGHLVTGQCDGRAHVDPLAPPGGRGTNKQQSPCWLTAAGSRKSARRRRRAAREA